MGSEYFSDIERTESFGQLLSSYVTNWNDQDKKKAFCLFAKTVKLEQKVRAIQKVFAQFESTLVYKQYTTTH